MADKQEIDEREQEILRRMTEARGGLNRQQAELAVDLQTEEDAARAKAEARAKKNKPEEPKQ